MMDTSDAIIRANIETMAKTKQKYGKLLCKALQHHKAVRLFTEAIELCPDNPEYYLHRALCYMFIFRYEEALQDARKAVSIDPNFYEGHLCIARSCILLGDLIHTEQAINRINEIIPQPNSAAAELNTLRKLQEYKINADKAYEKYDYDQVIYWMNRCLVHSPFCSLYQSLIAECLGYLNRYQETPYRRRSFAL